MGSSTKEILTIAASLAASAMLFHTVIKDFIPSKIRNYIFKGIRYLHDHFSSELTLLIDETDGYSPNIVYQAAMSYLNSKISPSVKRLRVSKLGIDDIKFNVSLDRGQETIDVFEEIQFRWHFFSTQMSENSRRSNKGNLQIEEDTELRCLELTCNIKHKDKVFDIYLPFILDRWTALKNKGRTLNLFINERKIWSPVKLHHPATFETIAMDMELKRTVMEDLTKFVQSKDYYKSIGKAWKRGYLLYGPPGTGKSSLVAAMANFLKYDIYDLELTEVKNNISLRGLLLGTSSRSIIVVEDIDCSITMDKRDIPTKESDDENKTVTLSGLLNFVDGLWSSCGEEKIIVFTTNYKERLDPALLRPGRMDMHIYMGYCSPCAFRTFALNYHNVDDHPLFEEIEALLKDTEVTPATVAEELMRSVDANVALQGLLQFLQCKISDANETK
ncbi:P-loop containing nucleoside triphosphate hydrolase protein [Dioscorea alata]|uniref:P-loop containing nucleoside triphosphate hydrolase protein n=1 Tax=Dioscorea alata TaxID=55571 RepID=A0ACB7TVT8_DIOAL|nr:P-loop containing nucleoside triphosphate hydrolase protein [Dioscorea alata]